MKKYLVLLVLAPLLFSCSSHKNEDNEAYIKDTNGFDILMSQFANNVEDIWGINEVLIAGPKDYVKYTDQYQTRSHINFDAGTITVETISSVDPAGHLRQAIISTLLMGDDPSSISKSAKNPSCTGRWSIMKASLSVGRGAQRISPIISFKTGCRAEHPVYTLSGQSRFS
jgi:hypothetical protein